MTNGQFSHTQIARDIIDACMRGDYGKLGICADMVDDTYPDGTYEHVSFALRYMVRKRYIPNKFHRHYGWCWWGHEGRELSDGTMGQIPWYLVGFTYYPSDYYVSGDHKVICFEDYQPLMVHLLALADALNRLRHLEL